MHACYSFKLVLSCRPYCTEHACAVQHIVYLLTYTAKPRWKNESQAEDLVNIEPSDHNLYCNCSMTLSLVLLNISWPGLSNADQMDFDLFDLRFKIDGEWHTVTTKERSYVHTYIHGLTLVNATNSTLYVHVNITAVNMCKEDSKTLHTIKSVELPLEKGKLIASENVYCSTFNVM